MHLQMREARVCTCGPTKLCGSNSTQKACAHANPHASTTTCRVIYLLACVGLQWPTNAQHTQHIFKNTQDEQPHTLYTRVGLRWPTTAQTHTCRNTAKTAPNTWCASVRLLWPMSAHTHTRTHTRAHAHTHTHTHTRTRAHTRTHTHTHAHTHAHTHRQSNPAPVAQAAGYCIPQNTAHTAPDRDTQT